MMISVQLSIYNRNDIARNEIKYLGNCCKYVLIFASEAQLVNDSIR